VYIQSKHAITYNNFPPPENRAVYEIILGEGGGTGRQTTEDNIIRHMRIECWITKAKDTHTEYVILTAFP
jgi:hypothetical protein